MTINLFKEQPEELGNKEQLLGELLDNMQWLIEAWMKDPQDPYEIYTERRRVYKTMDKLTQLEGKA